MTGYEQFGDAYKKKSRQFPRKVEFEDDSFQVCLKLAALILMPTGM
jgi:hypothetical protein